MTTGLVLHPTGLLSKWGFADGDTVGDQIVAANDWDRFQELMSDVDEHAVLVDLVRRFVLPACSAHIETVRLNTIHNPIRASAVNGRSVDWYNHDPSLVAEMDAPDTVVIPWADVEASLDAHRRVSS